ncbi:hypothetical protein PR048_017958 [Dryococelus australis]|uniref:DDE-1 domain-containing protein n=1 Tax=Dryococelus australis TaxID=614101 RepID=A0ABQ9HAX5_9NEOP|nr:hypothetical protein PR048_017958 [Dryococelus australis]
MAYKLAARNGTGNRFRGECAGRTWFDHLFRRHCDKFAVRKHTGASLARAAAFNREEVGKFRDVFEGDYTEHYPPDRVWNVDEIGLIIVHSKILQVVGMKGKCQVGALSAAEHWSMVIVICSMSAGDSYIPPMLIFPRTNMTETLMRGSPPGFIRKAHPLRWVQTHLFTEWLQNFITRTASTELSPVLLVFDGHFSRTHYVEVINSARKNHVCIISMTSHMTQKLQPLDRMCMGFLKTHCASAFGKGFFTKKGI